MTTQLPSKPDIDQLRRRAKELLRAARAGEPDALDRFEPSSREPILADAQLVIAREHGYPSWTGLREAVAAVVQPAAERRAARPLFADKASTVDAVFTASAFIDGAQRAGWEPGPLPDAIVFTFHAVYAQLLADDPRFERNHLLAPSNSTMYTTVGDLPRIGVTCLSPGATAMIGQVENQVALGGADRFVLVGTAGSIRPDVAPGSVVVVDSAVRDDGISQHYLPPDTYVDADAELSSDLLAALRRRDVPATTGSTWTVPTPYRSTAAEIEQLAADGVAVVECEVAALLAVAEARGVAAGACLSVMSSLAGHEFEPTLRPATPGDVLEAALVALGMSG